MEERRPSVRDLLYVLFRYQRGIALILALAVVLPIAYWALTFPVYRAEVRLLVKLGKESFSAISSYNKDAYNVLFQPRPQNINNELEILRRGRFSDAFLPRLRATIDSCYAERRLGPLGQVRLATSKAVQSMRSAVLAPMYGLGLMRRPTPNELLLDRAARALHGEVLEDTDIIEIRFDWDDPQVAALALNQIIDEYLALHVRVHESGQSHEFYETQMISYEDSLRGVEQALKEFTTQRSIADIGLQTEILLRDISELERRHTDVATAYVEAQTKMQRVRDMYGKLEGWVETPKMGTGDYSALRALDDDYFRLVAEREAYKPGSTEVLRIDRELVRLRGQKAESVLNILSTEVSARAKERATLDQALSLKRAEFDSLNQETLRLAVLERDRDVLQNTYLLYKRKTEELRVSNAMDAEQITSVRIVAPAEPPKRPVYPRMGLVLPMALFAGCFLGLLYALCGQALDHTFKGAEDVAEQLGVPLLATIPRRKAHPQARLGPGSAPEMEPELAVMDGPRRGRRLSAAKSRSMP